MTAVERVRTAYDRNAAADRPEAWILLRPREELLAEAKQIDARLAAGESLPLAGRVFAVKDNIDVGGVPTTAACPAYSYVPDASAPAVQRLLDAGALVMGKTNLDQFATGLVGTRSPYGAVRDVRNPDRVSGGSSSGSAVVVALGIVDFALGTDTAGSGRVPAAFQGVVGIKPTRGLVPTAGVVPACRSLDCVTVFAPTLAGAQEAIALMTGPEPTDPTSRTWPADAPLAAPPSPVVLVPAREELVGMADAWLDAFEAAAETLEATGARLRPVRLKPFLDAAKLLYGGGFVAERYAAVGEFIDAHPEGADPTVATIVTSARHVAAHQLVDDTERLDRLRLVAMAEWGDADALLLPTAPRHPTLAEVAADPIGVNAQLGTYTNFCNLFDLSAVAVPAGEVEDGFFGVTVVARGFADAVALDLAARIAGVASPAPLANGIDLLVLGAHLTGQPLNDQLTSVGARLVGPVLTSADYRMFALPTTPPKPGLLRVADGGASVEGELWIVPPAALGPFLAALPEPMTLGRVRLADGSSAVGFLCEPAAVVGVPDITSHGSWRAFLAH